VSQLKIREFDPFEEDVAKLKQQVEFRGGHAAVISPSGKYAELTLSMTSGAHVHVTKTSITRVKRSTDTEWQTTKSEDDSSSDSKTLSIANLELAHRLANAFAHAATIQGAKDDPF
jgi:hypothetical protein